MFHLNTFGNNAKFYPVQRRNVCRIMNKKYYFLKNFKVKDIQANVLKSLCKSSVQNKRGKWLRKRREANIRQRKKRKRGWKKNGEGKKERNRTKKNQKKSDDN